MLVFVEQGGVVLERVGNVESVAHDAALMFLDIGLGDIDRVAERAPYLAGEHRIQAKIEGHRGEDRDQNGGQHGDGAEPGDQAHMQAGAGAAGLALRPKPHQPPGDQRRQSQAQTQIDQQQQHQPGAGGRVAGQSR